MRFELIGEAALFSLGFLASAWGGLRSNHFWLVWCFFFIICFAGLLMTLSQLLR